ncbi:MAG: HNH endonuclease signature motif containing protein [Candidatus Nanopelagicales bacterium]
MINSPAGAGDASEGDDRTVVDVLLRGAVTCPGSVRAVVEQVAALAADPVVGDLATGVSVTDRVTVLARLRHVVDAEIGRSLLAAEHADVLPHAPRTQLQREAAWSGHAASGLVAAARFCRRHRDVESLWTRGRVCTDVIAVLARGLAGLAWSTEEKVVAAVVAQLPDLTVRGVKLVVAQVLDLLHPDDVDAAEQSDYDRRRVAVTSHGGMTMIAADLPGLEGQAVVAALDAVAQSLRVAGDGLTAGQRRADALITLVNRSAAHGDVPSTTAGLRVAVTVTMGAADADRVATGRPRPQHPADGDAAVARPVDARPATSTTGCTLGDAAARFALCTGTLTGVVVADDAVADPADPGGGPAPRPLTGILLATRVQPLAVGRATRLATPAQRTALALRDGGCLLCHRPPPECQTHHVREWSDGGATDLDNLVLLCWSHHRQVDLHRWTIEPNPDQSPGASVWLVTPVPRHHWRRRPPDTVHAA